MDLFAFMNRKKIIHFNKNLWHLKFEREKNQLRAANETIISNHQTNLICTFFYIYLYDSRESKVCPFKIECVVFCANNNSMILLCLIS